MNKDDVVCFPRDFGDARRPYSCDGLILWAYSSGNIKIEESTFTVTEDFDRGAQPKIAFYFGKSADGEYIPISVSGVGINDREKDVERYCVYTDGGAYYIAESENLIGGLKSFVDENKTFVSTYGLKINPQRPKKRIYRHISICFSNVNRTRGSRINGIDWSKRPTTDFLFTSRNI